jgi:hypothetical protein
MEETQQRRNSTGEGEGYTYVERKRKREIKGLKVLGWSGEFV